MENSEDTSSDFMERLEKQPALLKRFEQLLSIVENNTGDILFTLKNTPPYHQ